MNCAIAYGRACNGETVQHGFIGLLCGAFKIRSVPSSHTVEITFKQGARFVSGCATGFDDEVVFVLLMELLHAVGQLFGQNMGEPLRQFVREEGRQDFCLLRPTVNAVFECK